MLIGVAGKARAGKDTVAGFINSLYPQFYTYSFARPIKDACKVIFGWDDRHLYGNLKEVVDERFGVSPRYAMQTMGTEWGRDIINQNMWVLRADKEYDILHHMVVPDVRFENECQWIFDRGGLVFQINRSIDNGVDPSHESEKGVTHMLRPGIDRTINNDKSIEDLYETIKDELEFLIGPTEN